MKKVKDFVSNFLIYITIYSTNFLFIMKIIDADIFFDLRSAKDILTYGLDFKDHMTMFTDLPYLYHHWLYDLIIYPIFNIGGYPLVLMFSTTMFFIFSVLIYKTINKKINNRWLSLFITIVLANTMGKYFYPRVRMFNFIIMVIIFNCINKLYETGKIKYSIIILISSIIMVNMHFPLWILIPIFFLPYLVQMIIKLIKDKYNIKILEKKINVVECNYKKVFIITFILVLLSCFISPFGILPYTFPFRVMGEYNNVYIYIDEMRRTVLLKKPVALVLIIITLLTIIFKKNIKLSDLFYLIGLGILGLMSYRNLSYLYIFYTIIVSCILFEDFKGIKILDKIKNNKIIKKINPVPIYIVFIGFNILLIGGIISTLNFKEFKYGIDNGGEPVDLANYIVENMDYKNLKFFNDFELGSYLAYRDIPIFVDGRVEVYMKEFNGKDDIIHYYYTDTPEEILNRYQFDYIITYEGKRMYKYLVENNYEEVYSDEYTYHMFKNKEV